MEQWFHKVAIVTGASSGIGRSIAAELVKKGLKLPGDRKLSGIYDDVTWIIKVVGLARRFDRLYELKEDLKNENGEFHPLKCDMTVEEDILAAFQWTQKNLGGVDILINNAGIVRNSNLTEGKTSDWKITMDVNVLGLCIATREAVKLITERGSAGYIIHINSITGHYPFTSLAPFLNVYGATKYSVTALAETLRLELAAKKSKIRVTSISPGSVKTEISVAGGFVTMEELEINERNIPRLSPKDVSNAILYVLSTPSAVNVTELIIRPTGEIF